jgi:hypothetical protein
VFVSPKSLDISTSSSLRYLSSFSSRRHSETTRGDELAQTIKQRERCTSTKGSAIWIYWGQPGCKIALHLRPATLASFASFYYLEVIFPAPRNPVHAGSGRRQVLGILRPAQHHMNQGTIGMNSLCIAVDVVEFQRGEFGKDSDLCLDKRERHRHQSSIWIHIRAIKSRTWRRIVNDALICKQDLATFTSPRIRGSTVSVCAERVKHTLRRSENVVSLDSLAFLLSKVALGCIQVVSQGGGHGRDHEERQMTRLPASDAVQPKLDGTPQLPRSSRAHSDPAKVTAATAMPFGPVT